MRRPVNVMRCSAIIVTYNSGASIRACLEALAAPPGPATAALAVDAPEECETIVIDNASADDTLQHLEEFVASRPVRLIANERNLGFAAAVNQGAREASGEVLLILNPDAIAQPGAVAALLRCMDSSGAAAVGGALIGDDGKPERGFTFRRLPTPATLCYEALLVNRLLPRNAVNRQYRCLDADYAQQQDVEQPAGACLAVSRTMWEKLGGFDEQFFPVWFEDVDFCKRLRDQGRRMVYCPEARFQHRGAHSVGQLSFRARQIFWYGNMLLYAEKHFSKGQVRHLRLAIVGGMLLRAVAAVFGARQRPLGETLAGYWEITRTVCKL
jgi:N-acetylglucosaminyl-diphospho-decaprenol L-rhamnosyltransferase